MRKSLRKMQRDELVQHITARYTSALMDLPDFRTIPPNILEHAAYHAAHHTLSVLRFPPSTEPDVVEVVAERIVRESER